MTNTVIWTIAIITVLGLLLALVLFLVAKKFKVEEDPRIDKVEKVMPGANCGGCGFAGCRAFAEAAVRASDLEGIYCPVGGNDVMAQVAGILGFEVKTQAPLLAVALGLIALGVPEVVSGLAGIGAVALYYLVIWLLRDKLRNEYVFTIQA